MTRGASLLGFFIAAILGYLVLTLVWMQLSAWTSYPVASLTHIVLGNAAPEWVRSVRKTPGLIEIDTRIVVDMPGADAGKGRAELVAEADPAHYGYGLPLYLALLIASRSKNILRKVLAGYLILLLPQTFSLCFDLLKQFMVAGGNAAVLGIVQWQMEGIALGYQFGSLLLPTLAPVALWLWFERNFFASVIVEGWLRRQPLRNGDAEV